MENRTNLLKNNDKREDSDLEWIEEFYEFLQGTCPDSITMPRGHQPKLTPKKAMAIIWYLQEHFPLLPDHIEQCSNCDGLYDAEAEGLYWETKGKFFCGGCEYLVPINHDNCMR